MRVMAGLLPAWHGAAAETYTKGNLSVVVFDDPATGAKHVAVEVPRSQPEGSFLSFLCRDGRPFLGVGLIGRRFDRPENFSAVLQIDDLPKTKALLLATRDAPFLVANLSKATYTALSKARKISISLAASGRARLS